MNGTIAQSLQATNFSLQVGNHDLGYVPLRRSQEIYEIPEFTIGTGSCVFDFNNIYVNDEVVCLQNVSAPETSNFTGRLLIGDCTDMSLAEPDGISSVTSKEDETMKTIIQFSKFPRVIQGATTSVVFCLITTVSYNGMVMMDHKKPIYIEFEYDGKFNIVVEVERNGGGGKGEGPGQKILNFTISAATCEFNFLNLDKNDEIVCNHDYTPKIQPVAGKLVNGNCENMTLPPPGNWSFVTSGFLGLATTKMQLTQFPQPKKGESTIIEFCLKVGVFYKEFEMIYERTPIEITFEYDGSFSVSAGALENSAMSISVTSSTIFTAYAYQCNPDFSPTSSLIRMGGVLFICILPEEGQRTSVVVKVNNLVLSQPNQRQIFEPVKAGKIMPGTAVQKNDANRGLILGTILPAGFFEESVTVIGIGDVILSSITAAGQGRLLRSEIVFTRDLQQAGYDIAGFNVELEVQAVYSFPWWLLLLLLAAAGVITAVFNNCRKYRDKDGFSDDCSSDEESSDCCWCCAFVAKRRKQSAFSDESSSDEDSIKKDYKPHVVSTRIKQLDYADEISSDEDL
eukprot:CAMPEP_0194286998 /NCGR_PEP_ID=MMETSP0169-20130528/33768_1 /TAXON_ID=218684 /ORGANISM="Corethron pennatum, Strain L29A3" /LENGTH=567 /DNA_ID=CAMNT_0039033559 /DNA_START=434 /DNA_END=2137 /DNA_ORIENTATION=+